MLAGIIRIQLLKVIIMNTGFAAEPVADEAILDLDGMDDFLAYLDGPHSVGLDNMRTELRHMILLMMELQGYETGYRSQQMLGFGHTGLVMNGLLPSDYKKRKLDQEFWDELDKLLAQLDRQFTYIVSHTQTRIVTVREDIVEKVRAIDSQIAAQATSDAHAEALKANNEERTILKWLKRRLERHEEDLQQAETAVEAVQVHQKMEQDIQDVKQGNVSVNKAANRPNPFTQMAAYARQVRTPEPEFDPHYERGPTIDLPGDSDESKDTAGSGGKSGKGGKGGAGGKTDGKASGSGAGEKDDLPPPPVAPL